MSKVFSGSTKRSQTGTVNCLTSFDVIVCINPFYTKPSFLERSRNCPWIQIELFKGDRNAKTTRDLSRVSFLLKFVYVLTSKCADKVVEDDSHSYHLSNSTVNNCLENSPMIARSYATNLFRAVSAYTQLY